METLIFVAIAVVVTIVQKKLEKAKEQQKQPPSSRHSRSGETGRESMEQGQQDAPPPPRSLQDLIRQFENAQHEAEQGNIEPPTPPVEHRDPNEPITIREIAEEVIELDVVDLEFLMDTFDVDENTAAEMLMDLQAHRIVGRDMGEGECDVLVHDLDELDNLLNRGPTASAETEKDEAEEQRNREKEEARQREIERQRELNDLEERAKSARESAAAIINAADSTDETPTHRHAALVSTKNIADVRKGFIWAKVLDEPRFKRRWSTQYR